MRLRSERCLQYVSSISPVRSVEFYHIRYRAKSGVAYGNSCIFVDRIFVSDNLPLVDAYLQAGLDALGDGTRMAIFQRLANGPMAVNELAGMLPGCRPAGSPPL